MIHHPFVQLLIYLLCHPSWEVRKVASDATKKIFSSSSGLAEDILFLFTDWLSLVGERLSILKQGYTPNSLSSSCNYLLCAVLLLFLHLNPLNLHILCPDTYFFSISDVDSSSDSQLPFIPSTEVLVKCLFFIAPYAVVHSPRSYSRIILCSHHPCLSSSSSPAGVYKVWILLEC